MAKQRVINTHFWDDSFVVDLDPIEKLLFLYLLTNPCTDICGAYEINLRRIAFDTGIDRDMVLKILGRFESVGKILYRDGWILIHNFIKNQQSNPSVIAGINRSLSECPAWIRDKLLEAGDRLPQAVLLNLTKPNSTKPNGERPTKKSRSGNGEQHSVSNSFEKEVDAWLDAIAPVIGAKSRETIADAKRWRETVKKAVKEQHDLVNFLNAVRSELATNPRYFTPDRVLAAVQALNGKSKTSPFYH